MKQVIIKWKKDFTDSQQWYRDNPPEKYLSEEAKKNMILLWVNNISDLDSEAEVVIEDTDT